MFDPAAARAGTNFAFTDTTVIIDEYAPGSPAPVEPQEIRDATHIDWQDENDLT